MKKIIYTALVTISVIGAFAFLKASKIEASTNATYTVQAGDSLSSIAQTQLGDINRWQDIYSLNQGEIADPNTIYAGTILQLPVQIQSSQTVVKENIFSASTTPNIITQHVVVKEVPAPVPVYVYTPPVSNQPSGGAVYQSTITAAAAQYHVDPVLMNRIINCESGYNPNAYNPSGATGIAQFMPGTYNGSWNIYKNIYPLTSAIGQIYAMALKISEGDVRAWSCY